tara:strand:- start:167 stop:406 length:240 start_codon:yes stop_codon:yes gene_type:complete
MATKTQKCTACGNKRAVIEKLLIEIGELNGLLGQYKGVLEQTRGELTQIRNTAKDVLRMLRDSEASIKLSEDKKNKNEV